MRQIGMVRQVTEKYAVVEVSRKSACEGCHANVDGNCSACVSFGKKSTETKAENSIGARVGERVVLETSSSLVILYAMAVFILPLVMAFVGYFIGAVFSDIFSYVGAVAGFILSFAAVFFILERNAAKRLDVKIVKILSQSSYDEN